MQRQPIILPDWATEVEKHLETTGNTKNDLQHLNYYVQDVAAEIEQLYQYIREQRDRVQDLRRSVEQIYKLRFQEDPPQQPERETPELIMLDTPEERSEAIKEAALALADPGSDISTETVLTHLADKGIRIVAQNPQATVASVLYQFDSEFEKVQGRRSVFKRRIKT